MEIFKHHAEMLIVLSDGNSMESKYKTNVVPATPGILGTEVHRPDLATETRDW